jgi:acetyltransferase-like isoleucine patch superfamily enzyme
MYLKGKHFKGVRCEGWVWATGGFLFQKVFGFNRDVPWPVSPRIQVYKWQNIEFDIEDLNNFQTFGTYFQALEAKIIIGKGTWIAPNVGLITSNHDISNLNNHLPGKDIKLGRDCWIGMNSIVLPGVTLGDHTIVGAGSVVTKSFPDGHCVIAGNPAKMIRELDPGDKTA